jgi:hypothetical protein
VEANAGWCIATRKVRTSSFVTSSASKALKERRSSEV